MLHLLSCHYANEADESEGPRHAALSAFRTWCAANEARVMTPGGNSAVAIRYRLAASAAAIRYRLAASAVDQYLLEIARNLRK